MECDKDGCERKVRARGLCTMHYQRWDRQRDPERFKRYDRAFKERNRDKLREQARARYRANPEKGVRQVRRSIVKREYGLTMDEYEAIIARGCAICGSDGPRMALDHDHATGKVRDALCTSCNNGLGRFKDDPDRLRAAADYIESHRCAALSD